MSGNYFIQCVGEGREGCGCTNSAKTESLSISGIFQEQQWGYGGWNSYDEKIMKILEKRRWLSYNVGVFVLVFELRMALDYKIDVKPL